ncbi:hypothetical protein JCM10212_003729 [Sporobolomyces blumeae]
MDDFDPPVVVDHRQLLAYDLSAASGIFTNRLNTLFPVAKGFVTGSASLVVWFVAVWRETKDHEAFRNALHKRVGEDFFEEAHHSIDSPVNVELHYNGAPRDQVLIGLFGAVDGMYWLNAYKSGGQPNVRFEIAPAPATSLPSHQRVDLPDDHRQRDAKVLTVHPALGVVEAVRNLRLIGLHDMHKLVTSAHWLGLFAIHALDTVCGEMPDAQPINVRSLPWSRERFLDDVSCEKNRAPTYLQTYLECESWVGKCLSTLEALPVHNDLETRCIAVLRFLQPLARAVTSEALPGSDWDAEAPGLEMEGAIKWNDSIDSWYGH